MAKNRINHLTPSGPTPQENNQHDKSSQDAPARNRFTRTGLGLAIRQRREQLGWSQEKLAEYARIHRTYISSIELGKVSTGIEIANALAEALNVPLSALIQSAE